MRLWSLHPRHLDARGLVALWREGLLARAVLAGRTRGYRHHPQLERFRARRDPIAALDCYLSRVLDEARARGYRFDGAKIRPRRCRHRALTVAAGQLAHEWSHLLAKLEARDRPRWAAERRRRPGPHPCFRVVPGPVAVWERP
ncbi:MAG TPA: pyrimidine dimer DNA glycosylase/endonuclease V [Myxococcota bacterium]|nr:pyrimidine dimer DNA glycosylase/endonuclease V [Myxococcota bacterium]HRY94572.1 pyrimidine dimer DNA glycosylase/endonuclease V [Myxococcota bacterium]HSA20162.1 pyrimidine dimer DNA glycosylase/endonuclease V [Myxococcota bacterium]